MKNLEVGKTLPWILFLIFFAVLNETVFSVSTPALASQFALSPSGVSWMMTIFIVFFGVGSVVFGRLSDLYSLLTLIRWGIVIYVSGSLAGFLFQGNYPAVLASRAFQGIGGSAIPALVMVIVARYFAPEVRGQLFGSIGSVVAVALGVGPVIGGLVSKFGHWSWLFLIPVVLLAALPALGRLLPHEPRKPGRLDLIGGGLMILGIGGLMVWLTFPEWPWLLGGLVLLGAFTARILTAAEPFVRPDLFTNKPFRRATITSLFVSGVMIGMFFVLPLALAHHFGVSSDQIGLILFPGAISGVVVGPWGGRLADRRGNRTVLVLGLLLAGAGLGSTAFVLSLSPWLVAATLLPAYIGFSLLQTGLINSVSQTLPPDETGAGMGVFNLAGILAGAVGAAAVARLLELPGVGYGPILGAFGLVAVVTVTWYALSLGRPQDPTAGSPVPVSEVSHG